MKNIILLLSAALLLNANLFAQGDTRTASTKVIDAVAQMPAQNKASYDKLLGDVASTKAEGVTLLVGMLKPEGSESNAKTMYAISGLSAYVAGMKNEQTRATVAGAYCSCIPTAVDDNARAFIIRQLQVVGGDESVETLTVNINNERLSADAAMALSAIKSAKAKAALLRALETAPQNYKANVVTAVGECQMAEAEPLLSALLADMDANLHKAVVYALSRCGTKASLPTLSNLAAVEGYNMSKSNATDAYLTLITRVSTQGDAAVAEKEATALLQKLTELKLSHERIATMRVLVNIQKEKSLPLVLKAIDDNDKGYRMAALQAISPYANASVYTAINGKLAKANAEAKSDIIYWLGEQRDAASLPTILKYAKDPNKAISSEAVTAAVKIDGVKSCATITSLLSSKDKAVVEIAKNGLITCSGDICPVIVKQFPASSDAGKAAIMDLLAIRKSSANVSMVLEKTNDANPVVKEAAYRALKSVVTSAELPVLFTKMDTTDATNIGYVQEAIVFAVLQLPKEQQSDVIITRIDSSKERGYLYYYVLAQIGDRKALDKTLADFNSNENPIKEVCFQALLNWQNSNAIDALFNICKSSADKRYCDDSVAGLIRLINKAGFNNTNRYIYLRSVMEIASKDEQKNEILKQLKKTNSLPALYYAGSFLNNNALRQNAAMAVMNIALGNTNFNGQKVVDLLINAATILNNPDADYQRKAIKKHIDELPKDEGFVSLFNGKDLDGWQGLVENPIIRSKMKPKELAQKQDEANIKAKESWVAQNGSLVFTGHGDNLCTKKLYGNFEMYVDWRLDPTGKEPDAGIYLRGTPQVQIWDISRTNVGAQVGSGGLYNNQKNPSKPLAVADNKLGEWNNFYIKMVDDRVTVHLNGVLVTDNVILENYWDRSLPIFVKEQIELQAHGSRVEYRDIYVKELPSAKPFVLSEKEKKEGFKALFDGTNMHQWMGNTHDYTPENGYMAVNPGQSFGGNLFTVDEYSNFVFRFEFQLTPGANNGVGIRAPLEGDAAYNGMEIQVLDNDAEEYKNLHTYQYHGSVYGIIPAKRGFLKPTGEWNEQEIYADGNHIRVTLNGTVILDGDIQEATKNGMPDKQQHPGLFNKKGHIGFLGHGSKLKFRNIRIKELK